MLSDTVFGPDDREGYIGDIVESGNDKRVGYIFSKTSLDSSMGAGCTGTLVGPRHVLTAAHCLYDLKSRKWSVDFSFYPGINSEKMRQISIIKYGWKRAFILKGFLNGKMTAEKTIDKEGIRGDIGLIELDEEIEGGGYGQFDFGNFSELKSKSSILTTIVGYPGDKPDKTMWKTVCSDGNYSKEHRVINMTCDTFAGSSGSSLRTNINGKSDVIYAVNSSESTAENFATFITPDIYKVIKGWLDGTYKTDSLVKGMTSFIENEEADQFLYNLEVSNMCDKEMTLYLRYEDIEEGWKTVFWNLEPYSQINPLQTKTELFYYYAKSSDGEHILEGSGDNLFYTGKKNDSFIKVEKSNISWGRWRTSISCN